jgi:hypothetical protein
MSQDSDLSAYERVRLENIRKNNEFLASLGLFPSAPKAATVKKVVDAEIREKKVRQKRTVEDAVPLEKRRRSGRLSGHVVKLEELPDDNNDESEPVDEMPFYERIPQVCYEFLKCLVHVIGYLSRFPRVCSQTR